jgi:hypothetical protein
MKQLMMEPWLSALVVIALFALLHSNLDDPKPETSDEVTIPDSIQVAKQKRAIFDLNAATRMDDFLQQHGWVGEIVH